MCTIPRSLVNSSFVYVCIFMRSAPGSRGGVWFGVVQRRGLSSSAGGGIYDRIGCGGAVLGVWVQTAAVFLFLQKCNLAPG